MENKIGVKTFTLLFAMVLVILSFNFISAEEDSCSPTISLVNQDPNPGIPDGYMRVLFEITGLDGCDGYSVRLNPEYPFSSDGNESLVYTIASNPYAKDAKTSWMVTYKLKIDKDALDGDYSLKLQTKKGSDGLFDGAYRSYQEIGFDVSIQDSRTAFDAVIQDYSSSEVSIAIANVGKYTANSVVVRIPEQSDFTVSGTDGQMVGNIDSGDYTIVGFTVTQSQTRGSFNPRNVTDQNIPMAPSTNSTKKLQFDVYYTDNLGERRVVNMELPLKMVSNSTMSSFSGRPGQSSASSWYSSWLLWAAVVVIVLAYLLYRKDPKKYQSLILRALSKKKESKDGVPEWVKKAKEKEKK